MNPPSQVTIITASREAAPINPMRTGSLVSIFLADWALPIGMNQSNPYAPNDAKEISAALVRLPPAQTAKEFLAESEFLIGGLGARVAILSSARVDRPHGPMLILGNGIQAAQFHERDNGPPSNIRDVIVHQNQQIRDEFLGLEFSEDSGGPFAHLRILIL